MIKKFLWEKSGRWQNLLSGCNHFFPLSKRVAIEISKKFKTKPNQFQKKSYNSE
jgi:hypothetical protein